MKRRTHIDSDGSKLSVYESDSAEYFNSKNQRHRLDGPAIEYPDGYKSWWKNGKRHRPDGPAAEWSDGTKEWWIEDKRHRLDGPAYDCADGYKEWYVEGKEVEPLFLVAYWLERGRCCWFDESTNELRFGDD